MKTIYEQIQEVSESIENIHSLLMHSVGNYRYVLIERLNKQKEKLKGLLALLPQK